MRYRTQAAAARPGLPCGGDLSGYLNARASAPAGQPADARRTPPVARSLSRSRPQRWCRPVGRRGGGRGDGRGGGGGRGLARSSAWGGRFGDVARAGSRVMRAMRAFGFGFGGSVATRAYGAVIRTDGRMMGCRCLASARVVREEERKDKNEKTRGRRGGASAGGGGADKRPCLRDVQGEDRRRARHRARHQSPPPPPPPSPRTPQPRVRESEQASERRCARARERARLPRVRPGAGQPRRNAGTAGGTAGQRAGRLPGARTLRITGRKGVTSKVPPVIARGVITM